MLKARLLGVGLVVAVAAVVVPASPAAAAPAVKAELTIVSGGEGAGSNTLISGHSFLVVKNLSADVITVGRVSNVAPNETITIGRWGLGDEHDGVWYNREAYLAQKNPHAFDSSLSLTYKIDGSQLSTLNDYVRNHDNYSVYWGNCSSLATGVWNAVVPWNWEVWAGFKPGWDSPATAEYYISQNGSHKHGISIPWSGRGVFYGNGSKLPVASKNLVIASPGKIALSVKANAPYTVFPGQSYQATFAVTNSGTGTATSVGLHLSIPSGGSFVSASDLGVLTATTFDLPLPDVPAGGTATGRVTWKAPQIEGAQLPFTATAKANNAPDSPSVTAITSVGIAALCNPCGATSAGTGLRNRSEGTIAITDVPAGAQVTRAVLVWSILYAGDVPPNSITFNGTPVAADLTQTVSGNLCWGDSNTIGYAADVTAQVTGNGSYLVSDPPRGTTRVDDNPVGSLPYTDGASLVVFYTGGGSHSQVLSDFTYNTDTDGTGQINRNFAGIHSTGGTATLTLAGPDGQNNAGESFTIQGAGSPLTFTNTWDGSASQEGPSFGIGNLWDNDVYDVTPALPAGQATLSETHTQTGDCIGVGAAVLQVTQ